MKDRQKGPVARSRGGHVFARENERGDVEVSDELVVKGGICTEG